MTGPLWTLAIVAGYILLAAVSLTVLEPRLRRWFE